VPEDAPSPVESAHASGTGVPAPAPAALLAEVPPSAVAVAFRHRPPWRSVDFRPRSRRPRRRLRRRFRDRLPCRSLDFRPRSRRPRCQPQSRRRHPGPRQHYQRSSGRCTRPRDRTAWRCLRSHYEEHPGGDRDSSRIGPSRGREHEDRTPPRPRQAIPIALGPIYCRRKNRNGLRLPHFESRENHSSIALWISVKRAFGSSGSPAM
jgi:hypothetical protein